MGGRKNLWMLEHIEELCNGNGIQLSIKTPAECAELFGVEGFIGRGLADCTNRQVWLTETPSKGDIYAIALHEIGHICDPQRSYELQQVLYQYYRMGLWVREVFDCEHRAWMWARKNALVWTPKMEATALFSVRTYLP